MKSEFDLVFEKVKTTSTLYDVINEFSESSNTILNTYVNPYSIQLLNKSIIDRLDNIYVDGITLVWMVNLAYGLNIKRSSFDLTSHANELFELNEISKYQVGLIGGAEDEIETSVNFFKERYPDLKIEFYHSGYFHKDKLDYLLRKLSCCNLIICGLGTPKQEEFMISLKNKFPYGKIIFSCGAFFSQTAKKGEYYHPLVDRLNLRWVQRHIESSEVRRRHLIDYPRFLYKFLKNLLF